MINYEKAMVVSPAEKPLRDPFVLLHDGTYYVYGTGWVVTKLEGNELGGKLLEYKKCVEVPEDFADCAWAPEVHEYKGRFYMFTTYKSKTTEYRGCAIFVSDSPEGIFKLHSNGHVTPHDSDSIDATLYIDEVGQPWIVYVREWTATPDKIGRMACAKLSDDLTHMISEPVELFRADAPSWSGGAITDGCFMYRASTGALLMIWSNWDKVGYCVGVARSDSGKVTGPWVQEDELLYSKSYTGVYDGGHGMIFKDKEGKLWMSMHSPNNASAGRVETPIFLAIKEENGRLVAEERN